MFIIKEVNESLYKYKRVFNGNDDIKNAVMYCFNDEKWGEETACGHDHKVRLAGCSSNFLNFDKRSSPEEICNIIRYNHQIFNDTRGNYIKHRVVSFDVYDLMLPEDLACLAQYLCNWYSSFGYFTTFGVHLNTENPHIHLIIDSVSYLNGNRFRMSYELYRVKDLLTIWYISFYRFLAAFPQELQRRLAYQHKDNLPIDQAMQLIQDNINNAVSGNRYISQKTDNNYEGQWPYFFTQKGAL